MAAICPGQLDLFADAILPMLLYWTVRVVVPLTLPDVAVIVAVPVATPVAKPPLLMVAIVLSLELQVTDVVITLVVPFEYVPVATNCCVVAVRIVGVAGVIAMEVRVTV
jgi:hypothetical protein